MRCPECKHTQKYREGTRCKKCGYQFVFRKSADGITDSALRQMIQRLSDGGQQAFTATQLALEICRNWRKKIIGLIGCSVAVTGLALFLGFLIGPTFGAGAFLVLLPFAILAGFRGKRTLPYRKARDLIERYHQAHPITGLANGQAFWQQTAPVDLQELQYAPERILVVERDDLVDMLVRNRFHLNHKTAVVSRSGYPERVFAACREFLRNHPDTPVQVLHDASLPGFGLIARLADDPNWQFARQNLTDLGISRAALDGGYSFPWLPPEVTLRNGTFSADPAKMLRAGYCLPVDHIGPKLLINLLGAAVVTGALLLAPERSNEGEAGVEIDYG